MSEDIEHCDRCDKPFDDDLIDFYEDEEGGGIWCCEDCLDAEIEKGLASLQRENMSKRNLQEELRQLQMASPDCGVVYNGKSAEEWYTLYCQEVRRNDAITNEIVDHVTRWGKHFGVDTSWVNNDRHTPIWQQIYGLLTKMHMDNGQLKKPGRIER